MTAGGVEALEELLRVAGHIERLHARRYCEAENVGPGMPPWADMIGFRDKLAHLYLTGASNELLWQPGDRDLPEWQRLVEHLLATAR